MYNICAVVVTYNRKELLLECIEALLNQSYKISTIYIIDNNSCDGTYEVLENGGFIINSQIKYVKLNKNVGGAGGFYSGLKLAFKNNHDFFYLLDDDAEPALDAIEKLIVYQCKQYSALASTVYSGTKENNVREVIGHRGNFDYEHPLPSLNKKLNDENINGKLVKIDMASFVGILLPKSSIQKIGLPRADFFIHHDDVEYCTRLVNIGKILMVQDSIIFHKEKRQEEKILKSFLNFKKQRIRYEKLWIKYYGRRNSIFLAKCFGTNRLVLYITLLNEYLTLVKDIIIFDDHKYRRILFCTASYLDGLLGIFDNQKPIKILSDKK